VGAKDVGKSRKAAGLQRFALLVFGAAFVALFAIFAVAEGLGEPSIPDDAVAIVQNVPSDVGTVTKADFARGMLHQAGLAKLKKTPKPGDAKYEELKEAALGEILDSIWIQGEAEELGITVTEKQIATELANIKRQNFKTKPAYEEFLKSSRFTQEEVDDRVRTQLLGTQIQERISQESPTPSDAEVSATYDASKDTQYTSKPSRDVRVIITKDKAKAEEAKALLVKDSSEESWKKVAAKFSIDPTSKAKGGLQEGLSEEAVQEPLKAAIFKSTQGEVVGPVEFQKNFIVVEVEKLNPEKVQKLEEVSSQIKSQLTQQVQQTFFADFVRNYTIKWESRTFCASGFQIVGRCANAPSGHPSSAPPGCYEADPKTPATECPSPVTQTKPALPGSVTVLKPQGEQLAQRPRPEGLKETGGEGLQLPEGAVPPTGE
jgi:parvulin-like peptidyl-prolyl isomerase